MPSVVGPSVQADAGDLAHRRKLAKAFVNGKCNHFESSDIIIITGATGSGKSTFTDKFIALQKNNNKDIISDASPKTV